MRRSVDEAIDRVVAAMTSGTPTPGLVRRIVDELEATPGKDGFWTGRRWPWRWVAVGTAAATVVLVIATVTRLDRSEPVTTPAGTQVVGENAEVASVPERTLPSPRTVGDAGPAVSTVAAPSSEPSARVPPPPDRVAAAARMAGPDMLEPLRLPPLDAPAAVPMASLSPSLEPLSTDEIEVEPLRVQPLPEQRLWNPAGRGELERNSR